MPPKRANQPPLGRFGSLALPEVTSRLHTILPKLSSTATCALKLAAPSSRGIGHSASGFKIPAGIADKLGVFSKLTARTASSVGSSTARCSTAGSMPLFCAELFAQTARSGTSARKIWVAGSS